MNTNEYGWVQHELMCMPSNASEIFRLLWFEIFSESSCFAIKLAEMIAMASTRNQHLNGKAVSQLIFTVQYK